MEDETLWFHNGLRFQCTQCGDCCTGAPGYVWVTKSEMEVLAARLDMDVSQFEKKFVREVGIRKSLVELPNGDCIFLDHATHKCKVYDARPRQCRTWPFWESNVRTRDAWKETCQICPGSGRGPLVPLEEIQQQLAIIRI